MRHLAPLLLLVTLLLSGCSYLDTESLYSISGSDFQYNQKYNSPDFQIGDYKFISEELHFNCTEEYELNQAKGEDFYISIEDRPDCFYTNIYFTGEDLSLTLYPGDIFKLKHLDVTYAPEGKVYYGCDWDKDEDGNEYIDECWTGEFEKETDWSNNFYFKFTDLNWLDAKITETDRQVDLSKEKTVDYLIDNDFYAGLGGIILRTENKIYTSENSELKDFKILEGKNTYSVIPFTSNILGDVEISAQPYYFLYNNQERFALYSENGQNYKYRVLPNVNGSIDLNYEAEKIEIEIITDSEPKKSSGINTVGWLVILVLISIGAIIYSK